MIYTADSKAPFKVPGYHDKDTRRLFGLTFKPPEWLPHTLYRKRNEDDYDIVVSENFTGLYYRVKTPGVSGNTEVFVTTPSEETTDGNTGLVWIAELYNMMPIDEDISLVVITPLNGVTVSEESFNTHSCQWMIEPIAENAAAITLGYFEILVVATKSNGEILNFTLRFKLGEH